MQMLGQVSSSNPSSDMFNRSTNISRILNLPHALKKKVSSDVPVTNKDFNSLWISATPSRQGCDIHLFLRRQEARSKLLWSVSLEGFGEPLSYLWTQLWLVLRFQMARINNLRWCGVEKSVWKKKWKEKIKRSSILWRLDASNELQEFLIISTVTVLHWALVGGGGAWGVLIKIWNVLISLLKWLFRQLETILRYFLFYTDDEQTLILIDLRSSV